MTTTWDKHNSRVRIKRYSNMGKHPIIGKGLVMDREDGVPINAAKWLPAVEIYTKPKPKWWVQVLWGALVAGTFLAFCFAL